MISVPVLVYTLNMIEKVGDIIDVRINKTKENISDSADRLSGGGGAKASDSVSTKAAVSVLTSRYHDNFVKAEHYQEEITLLQIRDKSLAQVSDKLNKLRDLTISYKNPALSDEQKEQMQTEAEALLEDIDSVSDTAKFHGTWAAGDVNTADLGLTGFRLASENAVGGVDDALKQISMKRTDTAGEINYFSDELSGLRTENGTIAENVSRLSGYSPAEEISAIRQNLTALEAQYAAKKYITTLTR